MHQRQCLDGLISDSECHACLQSTRRDANHFRTGHLRLYFPQCLQARTSSFAICFLVNTQEYLGPEPICTLLRTIFVTCSLTSYLFGPISNIGHVPMSHAKISDATMVVSARISDYESNSFYAQHCVRVCAASLPHCTVVKRCLLLIAGFGLRC